jgi:predicted glutamine amidotransferase
MCRWAAYLGESLFLEEIVTAPCHSLIMQSHHALEGKTATNGDGFGIAWYGERAEPGLYRDILPAWSDPNLRSLSRQIRSSLFLAHVRASTGGATSRANCHPFVHGRWSFMHNGQIGGFERIRRRLESMLPDTLYDHRQGTTDSELFFLMCVQQGLDGDPQGAIENATQRVLEAAAEAGVESAFKLTAAYADGERLLAVRYASMGTAPSLYTGAFQTGGGRCVVSEPFDQNAPNWQAIPENSFLTVTGSSMIVRPFEPVRESVALAG